MRRRALAALFCVLILISFNFNLGVYFDVFGAISVYGGGINESKKPLRIRGSMKKDVASRVATLFEYSNQTLRSEDITLVVAHTKETLDWLHTYESHYSKAIVYHAETFDFAFHGFNDEKVTIIEHIDAGREALPYFQFIVDHYDDLPPISIFLHGNPFDHQPQLIREMWCLRSDVDFFMFSDNFIAAGRLDVPQLFPAWRAVAAVFARHGHARIASLIDPPDAYAFSTYCCAQFALSRRAARRFARPLYRDLLALVRRDAALAGAPPRGHATLARLAGGYIFEFLYHLMWKNESFLSPYVGVERCKYFATRCDSALCGVGA